MDHTSREAQLNAAFLKLAGTLIADFDLIDLLQTLAEECAEILDIEAAGIMLVDATGELQLIVSTSEETSLVEIMALNAGEGPCVDCFTTGKPVTVGDIAQSDGQWPAFQKEATRNGFRSFHSTPLRLRNRVIGVLNLFSTAVGEMTEDDIAIAQALADVSAVGLLQEHNAGETALVRRQLQQAIDARILIEQAKGALAELEQIPVTDAFALLRQYAHENGTTLKTASQAVLNRQVPQAVLAALRDAPQESRAQ